MHRCQNTEGSYACVCPHGLVGDPFKTGCKQPGDCFTDSDCPNSAACIDNRCTNPCDTSGVCGRNAECLARDHVPICRCPGQTTGNPAVSGLDFLIFLHHVCNRSPLYFILRDYLTFRRSAFIWNAVTTAIAVSRTCVSITSALIPAPFRTFADTGPTARRLIIARCAPADLAVQAIQTSAALRFSIAKAIRSARPVRRATEVYVQVSRGK